MVIDTSALLAIWKVEPEAEALIAKLSQAGPRRLSTATLLETRLVIERQAADITTVPLTEPMCNGRWRTEAATACRAALQPAGPGNSASQPE